MRKLPLGCIIGVFAFCGVAQVFAAEPWAEGVAYTKIVSPQPVSTPGKIEVLDVFSYACPACNAFQPNLDKLIKELPPEAKMAYLPAAFQTSEDWPVFQRAFLTAQFFGIAEKSHDAMYAAVWSTGTLATTDKATREVLPMRAQPTIEDVAKFYAAYGVKPEEFVAAANSFAIEAKISEAEAKMRAYLVMSTPTVIVNGKYMVSPGRQVSFDQMPDIILYLVNKEKIAKGTAK